MSNERRWQQLLDFLNEWSTAIEVAPGRIEVTLENPDGSTRIVEILMTLDEWDDMVGTAWGGFGWELREYVKDMVLGLQPHERFLIHGTYDLIPSATETLPEDPEWARLTELAREHPGGIGGWYA